MIPPKYYFIANQIVICNNESLKNREEGKVQMGYEKNRFFSEIIGLEAFPNNTHFKITVEPILTELEEPPLIPQNDLS